MSARTISLKWGKERVRLDVPEGESPLVACAKYFRIPLDRITLVYKGKRFKHLDASVDSSEELFAPGVGDVLVLGTRAEKQLDAPSAVGALCGRVPLLGPLLAWVVAAVVDAACRLRSDWVPRLVRGAALLANGVVLFFSSLVPRLPSRRRPPPPAGGT